MLLILLRGFRIKNGRIYFPFCNKILELSFSSRILAMAGGRALIREETKVSSQHHMLRWVLKFNISCLPILNDDTLFLNVNVFSLFMWCINFEYCLKHTSHCTLKIKIIEIWHLHNNTLLYYIMRQYSINIQSRRRWNSAKTCQILTRQFNQSLVSYSCSNIIEINNMANIINWWSSLFDGLNAWNFWNN